jgi:hypothetical protein
MKKKNFKLYITTIFCLWVIILPAQTLDICICGGTASGVIAAVAAKKAGKSVIIVEPTRYLGGIIGGGIRIHRDTRHPEEIGGLTLMMMKKDMEIGGGPHENQSKLRELFSELVKKYKIPVIFEHRLGNINKINNRIHELFLDYAPTGKNGCPVPYPLKVNAKSVVAKTFIDCSYEGDLMALSGVSYVVGRESRDEFKESLAGQRNLRVFDISPYKIPNDPSSGLLPFIDSEPFEEGAASRHIMAYNFRLQWVSHEFGTILGEPSHYNPEKYELVRRALSINPKYIGWPSDNYTRESLFSGGLPGRQSDYPDGNWVERSKIWQEWIDHVKIMHKLTNCDKSLKKGEFAENNDFPDQLYIRLGRRMRGPYVMTQHDLMSQTDITDCIGLGYGWDGWTDIYPVRIIATSDGKVATEGESNETISPGPYKISYRSIIPKEDECSNLLVPVCLSSTHIAMSSIRMEATWMLIGESAGIAAVQSINEGVPVQRIDMSKYNQNLLSAGQILEWDGTGFGCWGGSDKCWWYKHPEDYKVKPIASILKGPRKQSEFAKEFEKARMGKKE